LRLRRRDDYGLRLEQTARETGLFSSARACAPRQTTDKPFTPRFPGNSQIRQFSYAKKSGQNPAENNRA